ncbi:hypothetical protein BWD42_07595 [Sphingobacterium sp. CZ-UAM]|nr:hypothetical protein BWD42_07595 [Sphingobacterium sp. CZ-UAM]
MLILLIAISVIACKKEDADEPDVSPRTGTRRELTLDSLYLYAKQIYYWQEALPDYASFNPRQRYASIPSEIAAYQKELFDITQYKLNPAGLAYERPIYGEAPRYSFLEAANTFTQHTAALGSAIPTKAPTQQLEMDKNKTAYLAITSFGLLQDMQEDLDKLFANFANRTVENLIIDLRNNHGGYVETVAYLANLIAPAELSGKVMYSERYNPLLQAGKATILRHQPYFDSDGKTKTYQGRQATLADIDFSEAGNTTRFNKIGPLKTIKKLFFLVNGQTASASELLISCFKPYLPIRLIGQTTYGKPLGFFAITIDTYQVYLASFLLRNADGWSDYFEGIPPDIGINPDRDSPAGSNQDSYIRAALNAIQGKAIAGSSAKAANPSNSQLSDKRMQQQIQYIPIIKRHYQLKNRE